MYWGHPVGILVLGARHIIWTFGCQSGLERFALGGGAVHEFVCIHGGSGARAGGAGLLTGGAVAAGAGSSEAQHGGGRQQRKGAHLHSIRPFAMKREGAGPGTQTRQTLPDSPRARRLCYVGAAMTRFAVTTFGCQMNKHDSERLEEVLRLDGGQPVADVEQADVIVLNTCSVREKAEQKLRSEVGRMKKLKKERPELLLVVAGCMAQQEGKSILQSMPSVDLVIGPDNIAELPALLADARLGGPPQVRTVFDLDDPRFLTAPSVTGHHPTAFVTTMKGCNERCSFCVVPYTRGPERYRPSGELIDEIAQLVSSGVREVTLLGQTVNSYRDPTSSLQRAPEADPNDPDESEFSSLLRAIAERVPELLRLRYTSPHPRHLTASLIAAHRDLSVMPRHVHLPVQSGNNRMLKRMIRRHTRTEYLERVARLRQQVPGVTLSTDIIVGFSGETDEAFEDTLSLIEEVGFVGVFGFKYSTRPNTPALKMGDDVPTAVKKERLARLFEVTERLTQDHLKSLVGTRQQVLVEGPSKSRAENMSGRSERNEIVHIHETAGRGLTGELVDVEIVEAFKHSLMSKLTDEAATRYPVLPESALAAAEVVQASASAHAGKDHNKRSLPLV